VSYVLIGLMYGLLTGIPLYLYGKRQISGLMKGDTKAPEGSEASVTRPSSRAIEPPPLQIAELDAGDKVFWRDRDRQRAFERNIARRNDALRALALRYGGHLFMSLVALAVIGAINLAAEHIRFSIGWLIFLHLLFLLTFIGASRLSQRLDYREHPELTIRAGILLNAAAIGAIVSTIQNPMANWRLATVLSALPVVFFWFGGLFIARLFTYPDVPRTDLLMLRVFKTGKSRYLTHQIEPLWRFLGSTYTMSSEDYFQADQMRFSKGSIIRFVIWAAVFWFVPAMVITVSLEDGSMSTATGVVIILVHALLCFLLLRRPLRRLMSDSYLKSEEGVDAELIRTIIEQRDGLDRYSNEHLNCQGETWRLAVRKLLPVCEAVMMDVRGFRAHNAGIAYELGLVMDHVPLSQLLILTDSSTDRAAFLKIVRTAWSSIDKDSPNYRAGTRLKLLHCGKINRRAAHRIVSLLFRDAVSVPSDGY
jgi:hypothetical protein